MPETVCDLWEASARRGGDGTAFLAQDGGRFRPVPWREAAQAVDELAAGFAALGLERGDRFAICARTRVEWTLCDYALISAGAVVVPIYPTASDSDIAHILRDSGARGAVCETPALRDRLLAACPLEHSLVIDGAPEGVATLETLRALGRDALARDPGLVRALRAGAAPDDELTTIYTSGTTGEPKGCVLTHHNATALVEAVDRVPGLVVDGDVALLYLPLAHVFARTCQLVLTEKGVLAFCADPRALPGAMREVRPTLLPTSPRLFERARGAIEASLAREAGMRARLARWGAAVGARAAEHRRAGRRPPLSLAFEHAIADRLVLRTIRDRFGGRLRHAISGGAPLGREVGAFFDGLGITILEGYGLTECAVVSVNRPGHNRLGTVGPPLPGTEVRLASDGELLVRAPQVFKGYRGLEAQTEEVFTRDGWLRTGDVAELDEAGSIVITDRKKDIIVLAGGKNVAPQKIEAALTAAPIVSQALVVGDGRPYVVALIAVDPEQRAAAGSDDATRALVERAVSEANRALGADERVRRFAILERELSEEAGELTPTLKVRRRVCEARFREEIERLYRGLAAGG